MGSHMIEQLKNSHNYEAVGTYYKPTIDLREIAQYSITKQTTKTIAEKIKKDAYDFIDKCEEIVESGHFTLDEILASIGDNLCHLQ